MAPPSAPPDVSPWLGAWPLARAALARWDLESDFDPDQDLASMGMPAEHLYQARLLATRLNQGRDLVRSPELAVKAGDLNAWQLLGEHFRSLVHRYRLRRRPAVFQEVRRFLEERFDAGAVEAALEAFKATYRLPASEPAAELAGDERALEGLLLLWLLNTNPALASLAELFDDAELEQGTGYRRMVASLEEFFAALPPPAEGPFTSPRAASASTLWELLQAPAKDSPDSLLGQLEALTAAPAAPGAADPDAAPDLTGAPSAGEDPRQRDLQIALNVLREEHKPVFGAFGGPPPAGEGDTQGGGGFGPAPSEPFEYRPQDALLAGDPRFSTDRAWMRELVLVAKNALVWLDQLSRLYGRPITRLDEIPDRELDRLAGWGFTGLWLIGLWQRSAASGRIKRLCGNPEAEASAYSLADYRVAEALGGEAALDDLRRRCRQRGLRLACDMVPNHMGLDSRWVLEHPERFLSVPRSPFPGYTFEGPDLSPDPDVAIHLEDRYYDRTDAAVVFRRRQNSTGEERFHYHGNDGTAMPWNDTAQLDYLQPEVREAVIETILEVARRFSVIRFDAAMTLAKLHVRRLWYPAPGQGGDIPSRAEHALSDEDFEALMPEEFWREVVDRVAAEVPETLLLAEAFWLMESYFVRGLGMHRVYHSAFMHMLRDEDNAKFRASLKNTLAFDPRILGRFVNFLTTPDEATAAHQFGKGDKYFAVCTLAATLPGLPLFGHGQMEGLSEKYGMEYRRAYSLESLDQGLVAEHERRIVPLLRRRDVFAGVEAFRLYDFEGALAEDSGPRPVDENVYAFSNRASGPEGRRVLVVVHNHGGWVQGRVHRSVPWAVDPGQMAETEMEAAGIPAPEVHQATLAEALEVDPIHPERVTFRELITGAELKADGRSLATQGLELKLGPYAIRVFEVWLGVAPKARVSQEITAPAPSALRKFLESAEQGQLPTEECWQAALEALTEIGAPKTGAKSPSEPEPWAERPVGWKDLMKELEQRLECWADLEVEAPGVVAKAALRLWIHLEALMAQPDGSSPEEAQRRWALYDQLALGTLISDILREGQLRQVQLRQVPATPTAALDEAPISLDEQVAGVRLAVGLGAWALSVPTAAYGGSARGDEEAARRDAWRLMSGWLGEPEVRRFLGIHRFDGVLWFREEAFQQLLGWLEGTARLAVPSTKELRPEVASVLQALAEALKPSAYRVEDLLELLQPAGSDEDGQ